MKSSTTAALLLATLASTASVAPAIQVQPGYAAQPVIELAEAADTELEAAASSSFGEGLLLGRVEGGKVLVVRHGDSAATEVARIEGFNQSAELVSMRLDSSGLFGGKLLLSIAHDGGLGGGNAVTDLYAIDRDGEPTRIASVGSQDNPVTLNFDISDGSHGFRGGLYLHDRDLRGGSAMYFMDPSLELSLIGEDVVPEGRRDLDVRSMRFDPTGLYGSFLYLTDADDHDDLSGIYVVDDGLRWSEATRMEQLARVSYGQLAFSTGGAFEAALYATDRIGGRIVSISPSGHEEELASGFNQIQSLVVTRDGNEIFVSDRDAVYRLYAVSGPADPE